MVHFVNAHVMLVCMLSCWQTGCYLQ